MQVALGLEQSAAEILVRQRGQELVDQVHRALVQRTGGEAVRAAFDPPVRWVRRCRIHPGEFQRAGIDPGAVVVRVDEVDRPVRHDFVEQLARGVAAGEVRLVPAAAGDPGLWLQCRIGVDARQDGVQPGDVGEVAAAPLDAAIDGVDMGVREAGREEPAGQIHRFR
jgi:hypothetical protein